MADIFGGLVSAGLSYGMQKSLQKDAQDYNTLMWNKANAYNSPLQQMMRFKAAGLNPNLIYGQMNQSASAPTMSASGAPYSDMSLLDTAQLSLIQAQEDLIRSEAAKNRQDVTESDSRIKRINAEIEKWGHENNLTDQQIEESKAQVAKLDQEVKDMKLNRNKIKAEINLIKSQRNLTDWQATQAMVDSIWANQKNAAIIDNLCAQSGLSRAQAKEIYTLMYAKLANINSSTALNNANKNAASALKRLYQALVEGQNISNQQALERFDKEMQQLDNMITQGNVQADLYEDWPLLMQTMQVFGPLLGQAVPLIGAGIIKGGIKSAAAAGANARAADYVANGNSYSWMSTY